MASPEPSGNSRIFVPEGHVALVLLQRGNSVFYLEIPIAIINSLCLRPRKYLRFLAWCILGNHGKLVVEPGGDELDDPDGGVEDQDIYYHDMNNGYDLRRAVDLEVIRASTDGVPTTTESSSTHESFRDQLLSRDGRCVWTGIKQGVGLHIIPYSRGDTWIQSIVQHRPESQDGDVASLDDVDDIRNGVFVNRQIHAAFDSRQVACLRTPNPILNLDDIPERHNRTGPDLDTSVTYPTAVRYTLQWLNTEDEALVSSNPNNSDAAFRQNIRLNNPSDILLHYVYGATAVKCWGKGINVLQDREAIDRPHQPVPAEAGPSKSRNDRTIALRKRHKARKRDGGVSEGPAAGAGGVAESGGQEKWDEDDVMLFLWGNSQAAKERHADEVAEESEKIEQWRRGVSQELA